MTTSASLLLERRGQEVFAVNDGASISVSDFLVEVARTAVALPADGALINTCEDRYAFLLTFFAAIFSGRASLLPSSRTAQGYATLAERYGDVVYVDDGAAQPGVGAVTPDVAPPSISDGLLAAVAFTSGTTGDPQPNAKRWGALRSASRLHAQRLGLQEATVVSTVPPWHMYGLEWTVLIATVAPLTLDCPSVFYPGDVQRALARAKGNRVLVTTPVHLRALVRAGTDFPPVHTVVCATAPLDPALARETEQRFGARLLEIYGCSEAGTLAHREPMRESGWQLFPGFELTVRGEQASVDAAFLEAPVALADRLEVRADGKFNLLGRWGDLVKVAGKRASLADLTARLLALPGVEDGVIFEASETAGMRLCALVVAPALDAAQVRSRLAEVVDPAFLPRPLRLVKALPRSDTGKLSRDAVRHLFEGASGER